MSNQPYLYDPQANVLRQRAEMDAPDQWHYSYPVEFSQDMIDYKKHLASLPAFTPVSGWVPEVGKEYVPNIHFYVADQCANCKGTSVGFPEDWTECRDCGRRNHGAMHQVAVPIKQKYITTDLTKTKARFIRQTIEQKQEEPVTANPDCEVCEGSGHFMPDDIAYLCPQCYGRDNNGDDIPYISGRITPHKNYEQKQECKHEWTADTADGKGTYCTECHIVLSKSPDRVFTLADMIECWEAADDHGYDLAVSVSRGETTDYKDKYQYFKDKFNIDLP